MATADGEIGLLIRRDWRFREETRTCGDLLGLGKRIEGSASSSPMWNLSTAVFTEEETILKWRREGSDVNADPSKSLGDFCFWGDWGSEVCKANRTHCSFSTANGSASGSVEGDRGKRDPGIDTEGLRLRDRESWGLGERREQSEGKSSILLQSTEWMIQVKKYNSPSSGDATTFLMRFLREFLASRSFLADDPDWVCLELWKLLRTGASPSTSEASLEKSESTKLSKSTWDVDGS